MPELMPKWVFCPVCGERVTNRGLLNHVRIKHPGEKEAIEKVRRMVAKLSN